MDNLQLSPPWITFANELKAMFRFDPAVEVVYDQQAQKINIYVESSVKAEALEQLLVKEAVFGNVTVQICVIPGNAVSDKYVNVYATAFENNPALIDTKYVKSPLGEFTYIIWNAAPVQFFDDNLADYQGKKTMLMEDVARDVFAQLPNVFHCTQECGRGFQMSLGVGPWTGKEQ